MPSTPPPGTAVPAPRSAPAPGAEPRWPAWLGFAALMSAVVMTLFGGALIGIVATLAGQNVRGGSHPVVSIAGTVVLDAALVASAWIFARLRGPVPLSRLGLAPVRLPRALGLVILGLGAIVLFSVLYGRAVHVTETQNLAKDLGIRTAAELVAFAVVVTVVAPVAEEVFFRGFFFIAIASWRGPWVAAAITGLVFGAVHVGTAPIQLLPPLVVFGFVQCLIRWRTGSIYPCFALHATYNAITLGVQKHWHWEIPLVALGANLAIVLMIVPLARRRADVAPLAA